MSIPPYAVITAIIAAAAALQAGTGFGAAQLRQGAALLPGVAIGFAAAPIVARMLDRRRARIAVLTISALSAAALLLR